MLNQQPLPDLTTRWQNAWNEFVRAHIVDDVPNHLDALMDNNEDRLGVVAFGAVWLIMVIAPCVAFWAMLVTLFSR